MTAVWNSEEPKNNPKRNFTYGILNDVLIADDSKFEKYRWMSR